MSRLRHGGLVFLFFSFTSAVYTYPFLFRLPDALMVGQGDYLNESALIAWNAHQLLRSPLHLFDSQFFYPHSNTLAHWQSAFFPGLLAAPGLAATGQPLLVRNVLTLLALVLSGVFTYVLAFSLTARVVPSLLAGVVFAYFPNRMDHLGQFSVQMGFLLPLIGWAFYRFLLWRRWRDLLLTVAGIWAQILSSMYYGYVLAFFLLAFLVSFLLLRPRHLSRPLVAKGALGFLLLAAILAPFITPYLDLHRELGVQWSPEEMEIFSMDLLSIFDPGAFSKIYRGSLVDLGRSEGGLFPGFVVLGLSGLAWWLLPRAESHEKTPRWLGWARWSLLGAAVLCLAVIVAVPWSGGIRVHLGPIRLPRVNRFTLPVTLLPLLALAWVGLEGHARLQGPLTRREWGGILVFLAVFMYLLALGPVLNVRDTPWGTGIDAWVYRYVPGGGAFGAPGRGVLLFVLSLALLAALGARALEDRLRGGPATILPGLLLLGVMVEYVDFPLRWDRLPEPPPVYRWLAQERGDFAIAELPLGAPDDAWYMFWATLHWKRLVNGAFGFPPSTLVEIVNAWHRADLGGLVERLQSIYPLRYLVIHSQRATGEEATRGNALRRGAIPGLRFVRRFDGDDVYEVSGTPQSGVEVRRYFSSDFVRRHPVAEYDLRLSGEDPEVRRWVEVSFNGRALGTLETDGGGAVTLRPPYKGGDRNELRFRQHYEVIEPVAGRETYRIGRTSVYSPVDLRVISGGKEHGNESSIRVNGLEMSPARRGYNMVALDPKGTLIAAENFDTFRSREEARRMALFVGRLARGTIVVTSVMDDGGGQLTEDAVEALRSIGGREDLRGTLFRSHLLVGVKGARPGDALEAAGLRRLAASVGRDRPLALLLRSFTLR